MADDHADAIAPSAAILSTGDELTLGQLTDTNARLIAESLTEIGVRVRHIAAVGDDVSDLTAEIARLAASHRVLIMTGGLGPTDGDLTRQALAKAKGDHLVVDDAAQRELAEKLARRKREFTQRQARQAERPSTATCIANALGTAPGLMMEIGSCMVFALPGPPNELRPMLQQTVLPAVMRQVVDPQRAVRTRLLYVTGIGESDAADRIKDLTARGRMVTVNITASGGLLTIRARFEGPTQQAGLLEDALAEIRRVLAGHIYHEAEKATQDAATLLAHACVRMMMARGQMIAVAESCTAGLLGDLLATMPGASAGFAGGFITYSNAMKTRCLRVPAEVIAARGAVSREVAELMARGGLDALGELQGGNVAGPERGGCAISITGIAGPDGGSPAKPVGTVWIGMAMQDQGREARVISRRFVIPGSRDDVRHRAATSGLSMLFLELCGCLPERLLWQAID